MFRLDDKHLEKAKEFAAHNRNKKSCNTCYDRGYIGVTPENTIMLCHKCVDMEKARNAWKDYVKGIPELHDYYAEFLNEENKE